MADVERGLDGCSLKLLLEFSDLAAKVGNFLSQGGDFIFQRTDTFDLQRATCLVRRRAVGCFWVVDFWNSGEKVGIAWLFASCRSR